MDFERARRQMVTEQLEARGLVDPHVLAAMACVPRHRFVGPSLIERAYEDLPLPIGLQQTISQPYMVGLMTAALELTTAGDRVLEVGTGSGYQAAVLAALGAQVTTVERIPELAARARATLDALGLAERVTVVEGDGTLGWPPWAPYDAIVVTAGGPGIPRPLLRQLGPGGRLVVPVGDEERQELVRLRYRDGRLVEECLGGCRFVKLRGRHGWEDG
ncbi:MAG: protein-L-isoaspartate(D-aspartate) O-methyltransferase [Candidatus Binatia bacterium]